MKGLGVLGLLRSCSGGTMRGDTFPPPAIIELVQELFISNIHNKFERIREKLSSYRAHKVKLLT